MYAIIFWYHDYLGFIQNEDGSIKIFETLEEADEYANSKPNWEDLKVVSLEGVKE
jgi:hypothetical protein